MENCLEAGRQWAVFSHSWLPKLVPRQMKSYKPQLSNTNLRTLRGRRPWSKAAIKATFYDIGPGGPNLPKHTVPAWRPLHTFICASKNPKERNPRISHWHAGYATSLLYLNVRHCPVSVPRRLPLVNASCGLYIPEAVPQHPISPRESLGYQSIALSTELAGTSSVATEEIPPGKTVPEWLANKCYSLLYLQEIPRIEVDFVHACIHS